MNENKIYIEIDGVRLDGWQNASVEKSMQNIAHTFSFSTSANDFDKTGLQYVKQNAEVKIYIDNTKIMTGYIENIDISYSASSHDINIAGRSKAGLLMDSSVKIATYKIRNLTALLNKILFDNEFQDIKIINKTKINILSNITQEAQDDNGFTSTSNQTVMEFLQAICNKYYCLLVSNSDGNLELVQEGTQSIGGALVNVINGKENNILSASVNISTTNQFRYIEFSSETTVGNNLNQKASITNDDIKINKRKIIYLDSATTAPIMREMAKFYAGVQRARGRKYQATIYGYYTQREGGNIFDINKTIKVSDVFCDLNGDFLILGVKFIKNLNTGTTTTLEIVELGTFSNADLKFAKLLNQNKIATFLD